MAVRPKCLKKGNWKSGSSTNEVSTTFAGYCKLIFQASSVKQNTTKRTYIQATGSRHTGNDAPQILSAKFHSACRSGLYLFYFFFFYKINFIMYYRILIK